MNQLLRPAVAGGQQLVVVRRLSVGSPMVCSTEQLNSGKWPPRAQTVHRSSAGIGSNHAVAYWMRETSARVFSIVQEPDKMCETSGMAADDVLHSPPPAVTTTTATTTCAGSVLMCSND